MEKKAHLILEDGKVFEGVSIGAEGTTIGETVFTTGMVGYQEALTDPSFFGQIITQTYPLIGNYGVNDSDSESDRIWCKGYVVRECCDTPSNAHSQENLQTFLKRFDIVGIARLDTRRITKIIRETGVLNGMITTQYEENHLPGLLEEIRNFKIKNAIKSVSIKKLETHGEDGEYHVVLLDFGYKRNILRCLLKRGCKVTVVPGHSSPDEVLGLKPDGIMLSNGPGDPAENKGIIKNLRKLSESGIPIFGICLGHQLMALAMGAKTEKLKYGHRGANQPVTDIDMGRTFITTQNHGFAVVTDSVPREIAHISHQNANDQTVEGIRYIDIPCFTVQFHPEACAGPKDTEFLFDRFVDVMKGAPKYA